MISYLIVMYLMGICTDENIFFLYKVSLESNESDFEKVFRLATLIENQLMNVFLETFIYVYLSEMD